MDFSYEYSYIDDGIKVMVNIEIFQYAVAVIDKVLTSNHLLEYTKLIMDVAIDYLRKNVNFNTCLINETLDVEDYNKDDLLRLLSSRIKGEWRGDENELKKTVLVVLDEVWKVLLCI